MARLALCVALLVALAGPAAAQSGHVFGTVFDPSGAVLPGVAVRAVLSDASGVTTRSRATDAAGSFDLDGLAPGDWTVIASLPGFANATRRVTIQGAESVEWRPAMSIGSLQETITITTAGTGSRTGSPRPPTAPVVAAPRPAPTREVGPSPQGMPVRVGGNIQAPRKTASVNPVYPADAAAQGIGGVVILEATIGADGHVSDVQTLRNPNDSLTRAAADALIGWEFTPTLLNGRPVPVIMTATFNFTVQ
jgi:TonB family protein